MRRTEIEIVLCIMFLAALFQKINCSRFPCTRSSLRENTFERQSSTSTARQNSSCVSEPHVAMREEGDFERGGGRQTISSALATSARVLPTGLPG